MGRVVAGGLIAAVSGGVLVVALLLDWWDYPSAFSDPGGLHGAERFLAESIRMNPRPFDADAFEFFDFRDVVWLAAGLLCSAFGLLVLTTRRASASLAIGVGVLMAGVAIWIALSLISPLDFVDVLPDNGEAFDLGADLQLDPGIGGFVALAAAIGGIVSSVFALCAARSSN